MDALGELLVAAVSSGFLRRAGAKPRRLDRDVSGQVSGASSRVTSHQDRAQSPGEHPAAGRWDGEGNGEGSQAWAWFRAGKGVGALT